MIKPTYRSLVADALLPKETLQIKNLTVDQIVAALAVAGYTDESFDAVRFVRMNVNSDAIYATTWFDGERFCSGFVYVKQVGIGRFVAEY